MKSSSRPYNFKMPSTDPPDRAKKALAALVQTASVEGSAKETDEVAALEKSIEPLVGG